MFFYLFALDIAQCSDFSGFTVADILLLRGAGGEGDFNRRGNLQSEVRRSIWPKND
jgi:hypothetical protein